jgi:hypothetical protein
MMFCQATSVFAGRKFLALGLLGLLVLPIVANQRVFADGLFQHDIPATIGDREAKLFIRINPPILTSQTQEDAFLQLRLYDARNNETIKFTTFLIEISRITTSGAEVLLPFDAYHTESGLLTLKIQPRDVPVQVFGTREDILNSYKADPGGTINIRGPILLESGLYRIRADLLTVDSIRLIFPPGEAPSFETFLSVGDIYSEDVQFGGSSYPTTVISYYDKILDFDFEPEALTYSWSMPFNWDIERIRTADAIFVHQEIILPKSFPGVGDATSFDAAVNDVPVSSRILSVDPFSSEGDLTLHFLINRNDIISIAEQIPENESEMEFSFSPATNGGERTAGEITSDTGGILILLDWIPDQLSADNEATLALEFHDAFSGDQITDSVTYDLRIFDPSGNQVYFVADQVAENGSDTQTMMFPVDEIYRIEVEVKAITGNGQSPDLTRNGIARGTVVVPEFPIGALVAAAGAIGSIIALQRLARKS